VVVVVGHSLRSLWQGPIARTLAPYNSSAVGRLRTGEGVGAEEEAVTVQGEAGLLKAKAVDEVDAERHRATAEDVCVGGGGSDTTPFKDPAQNNGSWVHIVVGGGDSEQVLPAAVAEKHEHASPYEEEEEEGVATPNRVVKGSACSCGAAVVHYRFRV
jgi:hypothetical protein